MRTAWVLMLVVLLPFAAAASLGSIKVVPLVRPALAVTLVCLEGTTQCDGPSFQRCTNHGWETMKHCAAWERCERANGCVTRALHAQQTMRITQRPALAQGDVRPKAAPTALSCPALPKTIVLLPDPPYDDARGDCALRGKSAEVEQYLQALERIAEGCRARLAAAWQDMQNIRAGLDTQINRLPVPTKERLPHKRDVFGRGEVNVPPMEKKEEERSLAFPLLEESEPMPALCTAPLRRSEPSEGIEPLPAEGWHYTAWLKRMGKNVAKYCRMVDMLIKPIAEACQDTNVEVKCMLADRGGVNAAERASFHARLNAAMRGAQAQHDALDAFYTNALETYGWGNFRQYFDERFITCPGTRSAMPLETTARLQRSQLPARVDQPSWVKAGGARFLYPTATG